MSYANEAIRVRALGHLTDRDIARATGVTPSMVQEWLEQRSAPTGLPAERLVELSSILERLVGVIQAVHAPGWLKQPIGLLDEDAPIDRIAVGDYRAVARLISGLEDPGAT